MATKSRSIMHEWKDLRTVPALVGIVFAVSSAIQFGVLEVTLLVGNWQPAGTDLMLISLGAYVIAFASSETKSFAKYTDAEKGMIAVGPLLITGFEYVTEVNDLVVNAGDLGAVTAVGIVIVSWAAAAN